MKKLNKDFTFYKLLTFGIKYSPRFVSFEATRGIPEKARNIPLLDIRILGQMVKCPIEGVGGCFGASDKEVDQSDI